MNRTRELFSGQQFGMSSYGAAGPDDVWKADPVAAIIDTHGSVAHLDQLFEELAGQRKSQVAMCDTGAERT